MFRTTDTEIAATALAAGHLAALPTETVYGLGARADLPRAVARVFAAKGRPADHPLIVHVADATALDRWADLVPLSARALAEAFWPGPLTVVVRRAAGVSDAVTGGQSTVAVRVPAHPIVRAVLARLGELVGDAAVGVAAPSANRFGRVSPTTADHVAAEFAGVLSGEDVLLDGGPSPVGVESTIVDLTGPAPIILRPGGIDRAAIEEVTGRRCAGVSAVRAPGTLASHYAPQARVRLVEPGRLNDAVDAAVAELELSDRARVGVLALVGEVTPTGVVRLSEPVDAGDYARVLYAALREADALGLACVLAVAPPADGIGAAVVDRLRRAAH